MEQLTSAVHRLCLGNSLLLRVDAPEILLADARAGLASGARALVIDLGSGDAGGVDLGDPRQLAALAMLRRRLPPYVRVALAALTPAAQRVARVTHLHALFDIYADARTAVDDLSARAEGGGSVRLDG
jgi:hypothetical protein